MSFFKRYRRNNIQRATKPWSPVFVLDSNEVTAALIQGRL